ncbi:hypothetical protein PR048_025489 [Dryococelus australis]|uniref:Uncharacterized protein n=1 Tax=Dryococelus australis TaxID=614101 RepID=A0ABQ9GRH8_9NEOP|nr:hypothetical protein PR048_025489 [Dryococelus australis]
MLFAVTPVFVCRRKQFRKKESGSPGERRNRAVEDGGNVYSQSPGPNKSPQCPANRRRDRRGSLCAINGRRFDVRERRAERFGLLLTSTSSKPTRVTAVSMERRRNKGVGETGDPRENPPIDGIVRHDSHMRRSEVTQLGIEHGSPWWEASRLTAQPPLPQPTSRDAVGWSAPGLEALGSNPRKVAAVKISPMSKTRNSSDAGAAVAEQLGCSPPTKASLVQSPAGSQTFRKWKSWVFSGMSRFPCTFIPLTFDFGGKMHSLDESSTAQIKKLASVYFVLYMTSATAWQIGGTLVLSVCDSMKGKEVWLPDCCSPQCYDVNDSRNYECSPAENTLARTRRLPPRSTSHKYFARSGRVEQFAARPLGALLATGTLQHFAGVKHTRSLSLAVEINLSATSIHLHPLSCVYLCGLCLPSPRLEVLHSRAAGIHRVLRPSYNGTVGMRSRCTNTGSSDTTNQVHSPPPPLFTEQQSEAMDTEFQFQKQKGRQNRQNQNQQSEAKHPCIPASSEASTPLIPPKQHICGINSHSRSGMHPQMHVAHVMDDDCGMKCLSVGHILIFNCQQMFDKTRVPHKLTTSGPLLDVLSADIWQNKIMWENMYHVCQQLINCYLLVVSYLDQNQFSVLQEVTDVAPVGRVGPWPFRPNPYPHTAGRFCTHLKKKKKCFSIAVPDATKHNLLAQKLRAISKALTSSPHALCNTRRPAPCSQTTSSIISLFVQIPKNLRRLFLTSNPRLTSQKFNWISKASATRYIIFINLSEESQTVKTTTNSRWSPQRFFCVIAAQNTNLPPLHTITKVNMTIVHTRLYQTRPSDVASCRNCQLIGHTKKLSSLPQVCPHCAGPRSESACVQPETTPKCSNCAGDRAGTQIITRKFPSLNNTDTSKLEYRWEERTTLCGNSVNSWSSFASVIFNSLPPPPPPTHFRSYIPIARRISDKHERSMLLLETNASLVYP